MRTVRTLRVLALVLGLGAFACGGPAQDPSDVVQHDYLLESAEHAPYLQGLGMHLFLSPSKLSFTATCNHYSAPYTVSGNRLLVGELVGTKMGCAKEAEDKDRWLLAFLRASPALTRDGAIITLSDGRILLTFVDRALAAPNRPLIGSTWRVRSYIDDSGSSGMLGITDPELTFAKNGTWTVHTACSTGKGYVEQRKEQLVFTRTVYGPSACKNDNERASDEFVRSVLQDGTLGFEVQAKMLKLRGEKRALAAWSSQ